MSRWAPLRQALWLVRRELWAEWRGRQGLTPAALFGVVVLFTFGFALDPTTHDLTPLYPGLAVTALALSGVLVLGRAFAREREAGGVDGLAVLPLDRVWVLYAKAAAATLWLLGLLALELPLLAMWIGFAGPFRWGPFLLALALAAVGLALAGTLGGALVAHARWGDGLLAVLLAPLVLPLVLAATRVGAGLLAGAGPAELAPWFRLLVGYDIVLGVIPLAVADALLAD